MPDSDEVAKRTRPSSSISDDSALSKKAELLRAIGREIAEGLVAETILESLEAVEKLDREISGNASAASSGSMRSAYCAVALECTVKLLVASGEIGKPGLKYRDAFDRIWRGRVAELERLGESDLVDGEVKEWRHELFASFWDWNVRKKLCGMNTRNNAVSRVRVYLEEEGKRLGIPLLECEAELVNKREGLELEGIRSPNSVKESSFKALDDVFYNEEDKVLVKNVKDSKTVVAKPSPQTLHGAEIILSLSIDKMNRKGTMENQSEKQADEANKSVRKSPDQLVKTSDVNIGNPLRENRGNVPRCSLMEHNRTACTYEWDKPIHDLPKATTKHERRIYGPSPKKKAIDTLLENNGAQKISRRRKSRRWSLHEEDTLRIAVQRYGKQWKFILNELGNEFDERTEVDLKDKWRNMIKYSHC